MEKTESNQKLSKEYIRNLRHYIVTAEKRDFFAEKLIVFQEIFIDLVMLSVSIYIFFSNPVTFIKYLSLTLIALLFISYKISDNYWHKYINIYRKYKDIAENLIVGKNTSGSNNKAYESETVLKTGILGFINWLNKFLFFVLLFSCIANPLHIIHKICIIIHKFYLYS